MAVPTFTKSGAKSSVPAKLDKHVFGLDVKDHSLLKQAYLSYLAEKRNSHANSKNRGEISGGGRKPWRQKGTGNARVGSSRNPIWRGGGVVFGPQGNENHSVKLSAKSKKLAIAQALSLASKANKLIIIENFESKDGKAAQAIKLMDKIGAKNSVLLVIDAKDTLVERATRNLLNVKTVEASYLTVYDILNSDSLVVSQKSLEVITDWLRADGSKDAK